MIISQIFDLNFQNFYEMEGEYPSSRKIKSEFIDKTETLKERKIIERIENELEFGKSPPHILYVRKRSVWRILQQKLV